MSHDGKRVLVCGHKSFAAVGLVEKLLGAGHNVTTFSRGKTGEMTSADGVRHVSGGVLEISDNPHLAGPFDVVINYILLKDDGIEPNVKYVDSLVKLCERAGVKHLVHLSSVSVYAGRLKQIREDSIVEEVPTRKGAYGALKVASDLRLMELEGKVGAVSYVRPGFILGSGMVDPIVGMALRTWWNDLGVLGSAKNTLPVVTRDQVNDALVKITGMELKGRNVFLLADPASPTRREWLQGVCEELGAGCGTFAMPVLFWRLAGWGGAVVFTLLGKDIKPNKIVKNMCRVQRFDGTETARRLGHDPSVNWRAELRRSFDGQEKNFQLPYESVKLGQAGFSSVSFLGYGGIVKQKHLPALKRLKFGGAVHAFDVAVGKDAAGQMVRPLAEVSQQKTDLLVVASPGPLHIKAIEPVKALDCPVLMEKPLGYDKAELDAWLGVAAGRRHGIYICHNYRFKPNVEKMMEWIRRYNPGKLLRVDLLFQSPSIAKEWRSWTKDERRARTLLMDYSVHFLDLACMFSTRNWQLARADYELNNLGHTGQIDGSFGGDYGVHFTLRQGFIPRRARLTYSFQNYQICLGFFPDTFVAYMSNEGPGQYAAEMWRNFKGITGKVVEKLSGKDKDPSHAAAYIASTTDQQLGRGIRLEQMASMYGAVFELSEKVYGPWKA